MSNATSSALLSMVTITNMAALPTFGKNYLTQMDEILDASLDQRLGRQLSITPAHLSRVVYIPNHQHITTHLPLYDVTETYFKSVKKEPVGSSKYKLGLVMMKRPTGDGTDAEVRYLVDFEHEIDGTVATVERRVPGHNGEMISMHLPCEVTGGFSVVSLNSMDESRLAVTHSFPIPDTKMNAAERPVRHPWFTILHALKGETIMQPSNLEWQTHPVEHGPLRYTLIDSNSGSDPASNPPTIHAIYHHVGIGFGLPHGYSEGVLLLSEDLSAEAEALAVTTLLGLLRQVRSVNQPPPRPRKKSLVQRVLGKI